METLLNCGLCLHQKPNKMSGIAHLPQLLFEKNLKCHKITHIFPKQYFLSPKLFLVVGQHNVTVSVSKYQSNQITLLNLCVLCLLMAMCLFYRPSSSAVLQKCAMSNDYREIFNENATHDSEPIVTPTILLRLKNNYPFSMQTQLQVTEILNCQNMPVNYLTFKFLNIQRANIDIEIHRKQKAWLLGILNINSLAFTNLGESCNNF